MKYRKRPVIIEAVQFRTDNRDELETFLSGVPGATIFRKHVVISTREGQMMADLGDWIIKGVEGEFYPCKPSIFERTYEEADDSRPRSH